LVNYGISFSPGVQMPHDMLGKQELGIGCMGDRITGAWAGGDGKFSWKM